MACGHYEHYEHYGYYGYYGYYGFLLSGLPRWR